MEENKQNIVAEPLQEHGFKHISEDEKLKMDILRSDSEKFRLFTKMLRMNNLIKKAEISTNK